MHTLTKIIGLMLLGTMASWTFSPPCHAADAVTATPGEMSRIPRNLLPERIESPPVPLAAAKMADKGGAGNGWGLLLLEAAVAGISNLVPTQHANPCGNTFPDMQYRSCQHEWRTGMVVPANRGESHDH